MDLDNLFKSSMSKAETKVKTTDLIVSDDICFLESIDELYAIEGFTTPLKVADIDDDSWHKNDLTIKNVILDLRETNDIVSEVSEISSRLDVSISLIVVTCLDSIVMRDRVLALGANYVLWDDELDGLLGAIKIETDETTFNVNKKKSRVAKRVLILGSKGGIGVSSIGSYLSYSLSQQASLKTLLVEHDTTALNSDIFLAVKGLKSKQSSIDLNQSELDAAIASAYVHRVKDKLDFLALEKNPACLIDHADSLYRISSELIDQYNFIVDSVPLSALDELHADNFVERYHRIFVVCEPSVSSLRSYNTIKKKIGKTPHQVIFSMTRHQKDYMVPLQSAKEKIKAKESIDIAYEASLEKIIIQDGIHCLAKTKLHSAIAVMVNNLSGKKVKKESRLKWLKK
ncbi:AAA family ATPase [Vibrio genomosp. F6]|uniref:Type II secretion protein n=1 Tax=Vibrio genomosp. F6 str. FF-238 TaxID=1191298 RepID=A0A1E5D7C8_9VIBR|nr:type II/IV secretion system ATPase TadZ/CpaE [Vibrio genomosp. F6]OEE79570.1 type II secretion protein [Vibrio genomosp. F6 str. FF-238]